VPKKRHLNNSVKASNKTQKQKETKQISPDPNQGQRKCTNLLYLKMPKQNEQNNMLKRK
jgi:hypothetical protein